MQSKLIASPLNYIGGKYKILEYILPLFPKNIDTFIDLFCGGCNVGVNIEAKRIICNDNQKEIIDLYTNLQKNDIEYSFYKIRRIIKEYDLSKYNKEAFLKIRKDYNNKSREWFMFYSMLIYSFNYQIRFNKKGEYNNTSGYSKSSFNKNIQKKLFDFCQVLKTKNITFLNKDFMLLDLCKLNNNDFVYVDPPYFNTNAIYNKLWTKEKEYTLYNLLDKLDNKNIKFALSNTKNNPLLLKWSNKYNIHDIKHNYYNCCYTKLLKTRKNEEILITNY